jgi:hypothetical protein
MSNHNRQRRLDKKKTKRAKKPQQKKHWALTFVIDHCADSGKAFFPLAIIFSAMMSGIK